MFHSIQIGSICLIAVLFQQAIGVLPPYIKVCKRKDPIINKCITNSIEQLRERLGQGIPELNAPPIEPLILKQVRLLRGPEGARLDVNLTNIEVSGPSTFEVHDLNANIDDLTFTFTVSFDRLTFVGKYGIDARLLLIRLTGNGDMSGNFTNYASDVTMRAHKLYRNNNVYLNFDRMKLAIKVGQSSIHMSNLFGGDPVLGAASNEILNANSAIFLDELTPVLETALGDLFTEVANKITHNFTFDELFPVD